jgi:hypothetical protein
LPELMVNEVRIYTVENQGKGLSICL